MAFGNPKGKSFIGIYNLLDFERSLVLFLLTESGQLKSTFIFKLDIIMHFFYKKLIKKRYAGMERTR